jgi:hypothetical protein
MPDRALHIVSFDIPYPANYGGVIDVYYKIRELHRAGVGIHLHCFEYGRRRAEELEALCTSVRYYPRKTGILSQFSATPYIVSSRLSEDLAGDLLKDDLPVILEGMHTCGLLDDPRLTGRLLAYRESNIEHQYYRHLAKAEKNLLKKSYFLLESMRLRRFQDRLERASVMLTVSRDDTAYLSNAFPRNRVVYIPSFHPNDAVSIVPGYGEYVLYQGNLSVPENSRAAEFLVRRVWNDSLPGLVIAGHNPPGWLRDLTANKANVWIVTNPDDKAMQRLVREAHVNLMVTFQPTGLKLKLLNALFNGRFCLVNPGMIAGTPLGSLCSVAQTPEEFRVHVKELFRQEFSGEVSRRRESLLLEEYSNAKNCKLLIETMHL